MILLTSYKYFMHLVSQIQEVNCQLLSNKYPYILLTAHVLSFVDSVTCELQSAFWVCFGKTAWWVILQEETSLGSSFTVSQSKLLCISAMYPSNSPPDMVSCFNNGLSISYVM